MKPIKATLGARKGFCKISGINGHTLNPIDAPKSKLLKSFIHVLHCNNIHKHNRQSDKAWKSQQITIFEN